MKTSRYNAKLGSRHTKGLKEHHFMNREVSIAYAGLTGALVETLKNHNKEGEKAAKEFCELVTV